MGAEASPMRWREVLALYGRREPLTLLFLGFSSGLPLLLVFGTLSFWLREAGVERSTIGFISWVALAYGFKWAWAPLVDRLPLPLLDRLLGRRRSWLLAVQLFLAFGLAAMAQVDPREDIEGLVLLAVVVAFASATQDIVIDAFRIESGDARLQAAMAATYMMGYRLAMIVAGAGALWLAAWADPDGLAYDHAAWRFAYLCMAALMSVGILTTLVVAEPEVVPPPQAPMTRPPETLAAMPRQLRLVFAWFWSAVVSPFVDFFTRHGWLALLVLSLIATYRISDIVLGVIANVFYVDMGFSKIDVANVTKVFGVIMTLLGAALGGGLVGRLGVMPILFAGALLAAATNLLFALLAQVGASVPMLVVVVAMDNLSGGLASAAFVAYLSALTNVRYSATQYALFSSLMLLLPKFLGGFSGVVVDRLSYESFFLLTALLGVPVLALVWLAGRYTTLEMPSAEAVAPAGDAQPVDAAPGFNPATRRIVRD